MFLEDGNIPVSNNRAENAIRPFCVSKNTRQGKYTPKEPDGTRQCHTVYAKSYEECEEKLDEMIHTNKKPKRERRYLMAGKSGV